MIFKPARFGGEVAGEASKIYWPSLNTALVTSALVVFIAVMVGLVFTGLDQVISMALLLIFHSNV